MNQSEIEGYNTKQDGECRVICEQLAEIIDANLAQSSCKIWHGAPVWFLEDNPIVGYWARKGSVQLLFWSGQSFDESGLHPEGKFKAAEARFTSSDDIETDSIKRWLAKSEAIQWDYKNIVKRRGELVRLK